MSGLLALLDDIAALGKLASVQLDDIAGQTVKVGAKAAGVVIDDTAVTPKYMHGLPAARELPIVWKIARGSLFNKLIILLPAAMLLNAFAPWALTPLLMLGGTYLCFEGAEKIWHSLFHHEKHEETLEVPLSALHLEQQRVSGAIKTDFILSAEIMTISLASIESDSLLMEGIILAVVAVGITILVYGTVALLVKADDFGLRLYETGKSDIVRRFGKGLVHAMPKVMTAIAFIGTAAMLWVGGSIVVHGLEVLGAAQIGHFIHDLAVSAAATIPAVAAMVEWLVTVLCDLVFGLVLGALVIPVVQFVIIPIAGIFKKPATA